MTAGERGPALALGADAKDRHFFFVEPELAQREAGDEIGARPGLADGEFSAFEIAGFLMLGLLRQE